MCVGEAAIKIHAWGNVLNSFIDWLLVASGIFQGIFAVLVAYWGNRIHRTGWLGGLFMIQSFLCILVIIPTLVHQ